MRSLIFIGVVVAAAGCAGGHRVPEPAPQESVPHISWDLRVAGDSRSVCDSTVPSRTCVLPASSPQNPSGVTVHLFLHSAAADVKYSGTWRMPFLRESRLTPDFALTVPAGSSPVGRTISSSVVDKPGMYEMDINLDAVMGSSAKPIRITARVPIRVE